MPKKKAGSKKTLRTLMQASRKKYVIVLVAVLFALAGVVMLLRSGAAPNPNLSSDLNNDNAVNITDLSVLLANWNTTTDTADINADGKVNITDLSIMLANWNKTYTPTPGPEPSPPGPTPPGPTPQPGTSMRDNPLAPSGGLGQYNLSRKEFIMGFRFVLDTQKTLDRWYFAINGEGASCVGGRTGYGNGNGGIHYGRIVEVDQTTGLPTSTVLASESVNGCTAHNRIKSELGLNTTHQIHYVQFAPVTLQPDKMYAFLLSNTDPTPGCGSSIGGSCGNHMSPNMNYASVAQLGPNGKNTIDRNAPGATYGLDPRETVIWSKDTGKSWIFGDAVGWYDTNDGNTMMWIVGYRPVGGQGTAHGWPFYNWPGESSGQTVTFKNSPKAVTLTHAGGSGGSVGTITVTNTATGVSGKTGSLGSGIVKGQLDKPVPVAVGQSYTVKASGSVEMGGSTSGNDKAFGLGTRAPWNYSSSTSGRFPAVYASPHPYW